MAEPPERSPTGAPRGAPGREQATASDVARVSSFKRITTLKKRAEFLATRNGARWANPNFVLEALRRPAFSSLASGGPRFGFTVSKKVGGAVDRNRIKRRLRAVVASLQSQHAAAEFDYVLIARRPSLEAAFGALALDLETALKRVNTQKPGAHPRRGASRGGKPK